MADKTTTSFPKMGMDALAFSNTSAKASTSLRTPRKGYSMVEAATAGSRRNIKESLGHKGAIVPKMVYGNSPEAGSTQRNVRTVPNKAGLGDFWAKRGYGQTAQ
ncbi:hypothetical protein AB0K16_22320 [Nonomuraea jabiensis]|uniref:hypothetical protein n=1 Tax=Nonomuraea jabiensis TaxID=882448 RepID=UPI0034408561